MSRLTPILLALALASFLATAQAERTFRVIYLDAPRDAPKSMYLFDGRDSQEVKLPKMNLSPVYTLKSGSVELYLLDKPPASKRKIPADSLHASVGKGTTDFILLVMRDTKKVDGDEGDTADENEEKDAAEVLTLTLIEVDPAKFVKGGMLWCNLTSNSIEGTLGDVKLSLGPESQAIIESPADGGGSFPVKLSFKAPGDDELRPMTETKWLHNPKSRIVQFVKEEPGSIVPRLLGVADNR
jgi:hypothetical protein